MKNLLLSMTLSLQLLFSSTVAQPCHPPAPQILSWQQEAHSTSRLWWGLVDPELAVWFAHLPFSEVEEPETILWDWSWRGFLASIFPTPLTKEASIHAPSV